MMILCSLYPALDRERSSELLRTTERLRQLIAAKIDESSPYENIISECSQPDSYLFHKQFLGHANVKRTFYLIVFKLYENVTFECFLNIPNQAEEEHSSNDA